MSDFPEPGFYLDDSDASLERWWDGREWSDVTRMVPGSAGDASDSGAPSGDWDEKMLPGSTWARFAVRRPTWQVFALAVLLPVLAVTGSLFFHVPDMVMVSFIAGLALFGYGVFFHSGIRRSYGFLGTEPGRAIGQFLIDLAVYSSQSRHDRRRR